jgi:hypothetical protein
MDEYEYFATRIIESAIERNMSMERLTCLIWVMALKILDNVFIGKKFRDAGKII